MEDKKMVLIVDDTLYIAERLIEILKELNNINSILHAKSFAEASDILKREQPHIILLDIHLPDKSGIELLRLVKKKLPEITIIMVTNESGESYKNLCKKLGADYFIDKSRDFDLIPEIISNHRK